MNKPWDEKKHSGKGEKYFDKDFKKWFCRHCFDKYIEINQNIKYEEEISHSSYAGTNAVTMYFFKTKKKNPIFSFEDGIIKIGSCRIEFSDEYKSLEDREIKTIMKFGGTFIDVTAIHVKSGKTVKTTLTFD